MRSLARRRAKERSEQAASDSEKALQLELSKFNSVMETAFEECAPHKICAYIYDLANAFNKFYHETKILATDDDGSTVFMDQPSSADQTGTGDLH